MNDEQATLKLGTEKIRKLLLEYAIPAIIAMTAASLYNITDSIFIGHGVGPMALSGLAITFPLMNLAAAFGTLVGVGASTLLSIRIGQRDYASANLILGNVLVLNIIMGVVFSIPALLFLEPVLLFFGASPDTLPYAYRFMMIILAGNVVTHLYFGLNAMLRSAGNPRLAMLGTIFTVLINMILNPLFIFVFKWGIQGSAFATVIAQSTVLMWQFYRFYDPRSIIRWQKGIYRLRRNIVRDSLAIGMAPFLMNAAGCLVVIIINRQLMKYGGDLATGAYGIINRVAFLFVMIVLGLGQGMQPIAGYNFGAQQRRRVTGVLRLSIFYATGIMIVGFVVVELFAGGVASLFTSDSQQIDMAATGLRWVFAVYPLVGFQMMCSTFFQSIGKPGKAIILSMTRQVLFLIPLLLILPCQWGVTGVWSSLTFSDALSVVLAGGLLAWEIRSRQS
ncbi:MAG: MATE family efflux transporter [Prevotellaceae bacterium]|jgi:putative MATE family efflux protein|nr:MATE family efflux transporter [Prevotellaceae bacterium]